MEEKKTPDTCAVDIEASGARGEVISIGVATSNGKRKRFNRRVKWPEVDHETGIITDYRDFEERSWEQFWSKLPSDVIAECKKRAVEDYQFSVEFEQFMDELGDNTTIVSDNPSFDIAMIDNLFSHRLPMRYSKGDGDGGSYRDVVDVDSMAMLLPKQFLPKHSFDHRPENDAQNHLEKYEFLMKVKTAFAKNSDKLKAILESEGVTLPTTESK